MTRTTGTTPPAFQFWEEAMLPAWFVTSSDLLIRNHNRLAYELLQNFGMEKTLSAHRVSFRRDGRPSEGHLRPFGFTGVDTSTASFWSIFAPDAQEFITAGLDLLEVHLTILSEFTDSTTTNSLVDLAKRLRTAYRTEGVRPFALNATQGGVDFVAGIRIAPLTGLRLSRDAEVGEATIRFVDVVIAYRLTLDWSDSDSRVRISFQGIQPAIHDATDRHDEMLPRVQKQSVDEGRQIIIHDVVHQMASLLGFVWEEGSHLSADRQFCLWEAVTQVTDIWSQQAFREPRSLVCGGTLDFPDWPIDSSPHQVLERLVDASLRHALSRLHRPPSSGSDSKADVPSLTLHLTISALRTRIGFEIPDNLPHFVRFRAFAVCFHHAFWQAAYHAFIASLDTDVEGPFLRLECTNSSVRIANREGSRETRSYAQSPPQPQDARFFALVNRKLEGVFEISGPALAEGRTWVTRIDYYEDASR